MSEDFTRRSQHLAGIEALFKQSPQDFEVEEVAAYEPCGEGPHVYMWVEERDASASYSLRQLARFFGVRERDVGRAGLKDRQAVTRQWYSFPADQIEAQALEQMPGELSEQIRVLRVSAHQNKLRRGHLVGNRFALRLLLAQHEDGEEARERAAAIMDFLQEHGAPNFYGDQRFGRNGGTAALGFELLAQQSEAKRRVQRDRFLKRLALNAAQSELFNAALMQRAREGSLERVLPGDVLMRRESGGVFVSEDVAADQQRMDQGELVVAGPMFGPSMKAACGEVAAREQALLDAHQVSLEDFAAYNKLCAGARRPMLVWPQDVSVELESAHALLVRFFLPSGSYATVLLSEILTAHDTESQDS